MEYYTYAYLREDGTPYYIGKGKAGRITNNLHRIAIPKEKERIIYLKKNLGGDGCAGRILSNETKKKLSEAHKDRMKSLEHKKALSEAAKKRKASDKWKKFVSASLKGIMAKEKNPSWGKKWWNNGVENKFSKECPGKDFSLGRLINRE